MKTKNPRILHFTVTFPLVTSLNQRWFQVRHSSLLSSFGPSTILFLYYICLAEHPPWLIPALSHTHIAWTSEALSSPFPPPVVTPMLTSLPANLWLQPCDSLHCFKFQLNSLDQGLANIFWKGPDRKYIKLRGPCGFCHNSAIVAGKQPQTVLKWMGVAIFQLKYLRKQAVGWIWPKSCGLMTFFQTNLLLS